MINQKDQNFIINLNQIIDYNILKEYGHHILNNFGSIVYDELEYNIIDKHINYITESEFDKISTYQILTIHKNTIIKKFGEQFFNDKMKLYL